MCVLPTLLCIQSCLNPAHVQVLHGHYHMYLYCSSKYSYYFALPGKNRHCMVSSLMYQKWWLKDKGPITRRTPLVNKSILGAHCFNIYLSYHTIQQLATFYKPVEWTNGEYCLWSTPQWPFCRGTTTSSNSSLCPPKCNSIDVVPLGSPAAATKPRATARWHTSSFQQFKQYHSTSKRWNKN